MVCESLHVCVCSLSLSLSLTLSLLSLSPPPSLPPPLQYSDIEWTLWDRFDVKGLKDDGSEMTLGEFIDYFKTQHKLDINMLSYDVSILYSFFMQKTKVEARMGMP